MDEIERKFLIEKENVPKNIEEYAFHEIEQAYLCVNPVVRIRKQDDEFVLTYKGAGMLKRREENLPLTKEGYYHLLEKADGTVITKRRYKIPLDDTHIIELDCFKGAYEGLILAEVEFANEQEAEEFQKPEWFGEDVTFDGRYHNSNMSKMKADCLELEAKRVF